MNKSIRTLTVAIVSVMLSWPVMAAEMFREDVMHKSHPPKEEVNKVTKDGCDCKTYSDKQLEEYKKNHPMNSNILRDKK